MLEQAVHVPFALADEPSKYSLVPQVGRFLQPSSYTPHEPERYRFELHLTFLQAAHFQLVS